MIGGWVELSVKVIEIFNCKGLLIFILQIGTVLIEFNQLTKDMLIIRRYQGQAIPLVWNYSRMVIPYGLEQLVTLKLELVLIKTALALKLGIVLLTPMHGILRINRLYPPAFLLKLKDFTLIVVGPLRQCRRVVLAHFSIVF